MSPRPSVLVVDDDEDVREMLVFLLEARGYHAAAAVDGLAALERVERERPSLILLDLRMPRLNGEQFLERLRAREDGRAIPVVIISGDHAAPALVGSLGANEYLAKPIELVALLGVLERLGPRAR